MQAVTVAEAQKGHVDTGREEAEMRWERSVDTDTLPLQ